MIRFLYKTLFKKFIYKNKFLFKILKAYWIINYLVKIILNKKIFFELTQSQHNDKEALFLEELITKVKNKTFVEIGFHFKQFNSVRLIKNNLQGKLIDTSKFDLLNILISKFIMKLINKNVKIIDSFITPKNVTQIFDNDNLGYLSIDIDGNDYWVLSEILKKGVKPEVIILEYNASLLKNSITIPLIENFDFYAFNKSQCYHGASLTAFEKLLTKRGYYLIKCIEGVNAIFVNHEIFKKLAVPVLYAKDINQECLSRNKKLNNTSKDQYESIKHLPFVQV